MLREGFHCQDIILESLHQVTPITIATPILQFWRPHKSALHSLYSICTSYRTVFRRCKSRVLESWCFSAWNKSAPIGRVFMKF